MAPITHIVLFKYSSSISWIDLEEHFKEFTAFRTTCLKPNGKPYMISMQMGKNHSWEPYSKGMTHAFILEFANAEDRDYYLLKDPVHHAFSAKAGPLIEDSLVIGRCESQRIERIFR
jgi:Stress responsive A/B Barrel Domain